MLRKLLFALVLTLGLSQLASALTLTTIGSAITTNTTGTAVGVRTNEYKTFWGQVVCSSGACTQTQAIYGDVDDDATNGVLLCTITLSGTTRTQDACPPTKANFPYFYYVTTATTGTSATGLIYAIY